MVAVLVALVIGHPIGGMTCGDTGDRYGWYVNATQVIVLSEQWTCPYLTRRATDSERANAYLTVVHEAEHARGIMDEHAANCQAIRDLPAVGRALHLSRLGQVLSWARMIRRDMAPPYGGAC